MLPLYGVSTQYSNRTWGPTLTLEEEELVTLTTWMLNVPGASGLQPSGAELSGVRESVTPWGRGFARAVVAKANRAAEYFMVYEWVIRAKVCRPLSE